MEPPQLHETNTGPVPAPAPAPAPVPPFLIKTYELVDDLSTDHIVSWSKENNSFVIWDLQNFSVLVLPKYFKHNNISSFVRQLNTYGFRKVDPERWEFANEGFLRGRKNLLKNIKRRKITIQDNLHQNVDSCVEVGHFGLDGEVDQLKRDKQVLMVELVKLRQQQQSTIASLQAMEDKFKRTEMKQQQMMTFLARAMQSPNFLHQLDQQKDLRKEIEQEITKRRRLKIGRNHSKRGVGEVESSIKAEPCSSYSENTEFQAAENRGNPEKEFTKEDEKETDEVFWENLLNEDAEEGAEGFGILRYDGEGEDDVNMISGYLGSCFLELERVLD